MATQNGGQPNFIFFLKVLFIIDKQVLKIKVTNGGQPDFIIFRLTVSLMEKKYKITNWSSKHIYHNKVVQSLMKCVGLHENDVNFVKMQIWTLVLIEKTPPAFYLDFFSLFSLIKLEYIIMLFTQSFFFNDKIVIWNLQMSLPGDWARLHSHIKILQHVGQLQALKYKTALGIRS